MLLKYGLVQGDHGIRALDVGDFLDGVQKNLHQVVVVQAVELGQDGVFAGHKMTLHNFGNLLQVGNHLRVFGRLGKGDANKGAHVQTQGLRLYLQTGPRNNPVGFQSLVALVDGRTGNAAFTGNFQEGHTGVFDKVRKNFLIYLVYVITGHLLTILN